jgi:hypothetical protein
MISILNNYFYKYVYPLATPQTSTDYTVTASYAGCKDSSQYVRIKVLKGFELANNDTTVCSGNTVHLNAIGDVGYTYKWSPGTYLSNSSLANVSAKPDATISYTVTASYPGCRDTSQTVTITVEPVPQIAPLQPQKVCVGETIRLGATISPDSFSGYNFKWSPVSSFSNPTIKNPIYKALGSFEVSLIFSTSNGCADTVSQFFKAGLLPMVDAGPDKIINFGTPVLLQGVVGNTATSLQWYPGSYLSASNIPAPSANPPVTQQYVLLATSADGCTNSNTVLVTVLKELYIPNAFSPNGDGINDVWNIPGLNSCQNCKIQVFNRCGQLVFESKVMQNLGMAFSKDSNCQSAFIIISLALRKVKQQ